MKKIWNEKTIPMKILFVFGIVLSIVVFTCALLGLLGIVDGLDIIYMPGLSLIMFIQGIEYWKSNRSTSILSFIVGIFIAITVVLKYVR